MISISYTPFLDKEMPHLNISKLENDWLPCRCHHLMIGEIGIILNDAQVKALIEKLVTYNANLESTDKSLCQSTDKSETEPEGTNSL